MRSQRILSGGCKKTRSRFFGGGAQTFLGLSDTPNSYTGEGGKVVVVKATENGLEFNTEAAIDRHDVKASATDATPDFLDGKVDNTTIEISGDKLQVKNAGKILVDTGDTNYNWLAAKIQCLRGIFTAVFTSPFPPFEKFLQLDMTVDEGVGGTLDFNGTTLRVKPLGISDAQVATANKDGTAATPSMRTLGTGALQAAAGNDTRLSDDRTPLAHDLAGAKHNADTITNLNLKLSDGDVLSTKAGEIAALTAKGTPTTSDLLVIEDAAAANAKKKITISSLPAAAPAAHDLAGAQHNADTITNLNLKLSDGDVLSTKAGEIAALTAKGTPTTSDLLVIEDAAAANAKKKITISSLPAAAPAAHDLAGAQHNADTITNLNLKLSDGDVLSTKAGEIAALTAKAAPVDADIVVIEDSADSNNKKKLTLLNLRTYSTQIICRGAEIYNPSGIVQADNIICWRAPYACTVTNVRGYRVGGTGATVNARKNGASNHLASALSLTSADTWQDGGAVQNTSYAAGDKMEIMLVSVSGSPTQIMIQIDLTRATS